MKLHNLGYPRIGSHRELKFALESYWKNELSAESLAAQASSLRLRHLALQADFAYLPVNDFSFYDQILDWTLTVGAIPQRYQSLIPQNPTETALFPLYFAMARGLQNESVDVPAMEMTKWFDTNYHYIVPELNENSSFELLSQKIFREVKEAQSLGLKPTPVIPGPVTFLSLAKTTDGSDALSLLDKLLPVYTKILTELAALKVDFVQIDEPILVTDLSETQASALRRAFTTLATCGPKILLNTYFGCLQDNLDLAANLPIQAIHLDLTRNTLNPEILAEAFAHLEFISLGVVDGRNVWLNDYAKSLQIIEKISAKKACSSLILAPSCSLLHSPCDLESEKAAKSIPGEILDWLAFARQKLQELRELAILAETADFAQNPLFLLNQASINNRRKSQLVNNSTVADRMVQWQENPGRRPQPFSDRITAQQQKLQLPALPSTTIGSFPQTKEVRRQRFQFRKGKLDEVSYDAFVKTSITDCIKLQEDLELDVLVHGEFERNDMVEFFGEKLDGFTFSGFGWVQSYGSRCVKPPIIFGDVSRPTPMTVDYTRFAQSLTEKPVKGMLTGPVTILQWSFVRDDQPRRETCRQIALAVQDEVKDLESAGIDIIQIDEPALREGLPLRKAAAETYLDWAVESFRLSACTVEPTTQIHTHMCYCDFNNIVHSIADLDADVISIESSRSDMELLEAFTSESYSSHIGPGLYDIHSPRVPSVTEMADRLASILEKLPADQVWINPDCGLKTRDWPETEAALRNMVEAAKQFRK